MNYSTSIFLINNQVRAIKATYDEGQTPEVFKTLDPSISEGDYVVVPTDTRHKMTVCQVVETDIDIDFDDPKPIKWIIDQIDASGHEKILAQEREAIKAIKSAELRQKREALRDAMFADHVETLKALPIAAIDDPATKTPESAE